MRRETILPNGIERGLIAAADTEIITASVLEYFGLTIDELRLRNRAHKVLIPRHYIHYFNSVTGTSLRQIGIITMLDHATVIRSRDIIEAWMQTDKHFRAQTYAIAQLIINNHLLKQTKDESTDL